ncbi:MAG: hypothetical protein ACREV5_04755 [Steroidobacter sp.]
MKVRYLTRVCCWALLSVAASVAGCSPGEPGAEAPQAPSTKVETSGKEQISPDELPTEVLAAARSARPELEISAAEHEVRNGADYYDVAGKVNGGEVELDITRVADRWTVVEVQRDLEAANVPAEVSAALSAANPSFNTTRIIESDQGAGVVIYEFFGAGADGKDAKIEVRLQNGKADVLTSEWVH